MSTEDCSSDFDVWIVGFDQFRQFVDSRAGGGDIVDDEDGFVAEEGEIGDQRKCIFQIF